MGLFGKKGEVTAVEKTDEVILKEELDSEVEKLQIEFRAKQEKISEHEKNYSR